MSKKTDNPKELPPFHFFGSTAFNWAVGQSRAEVLEKLGRMAGADMLKRQVKANGGLYAWTCKVDVRQDVNYAINNYVPVDVPRSEPQEFNIMNAKGWSLPRVLGG